MIFNGYNLSLPSPYDKRLFETHIYVEDLARSIDFALEFIAILEGEAKPELGVIFYEEWLSK